MATAYEPSIFASPPVGVPGIPPLEPGDHLDQPTFHERYEAMPPGFRAELIEGVVIVPSPVSLTHGVYHSRMMAWTAFYQSATPGTETADNTTTVLSRKNEPQPDVSLFLLEDRGGQMRVEGKFLAGAPELVVEVAYSSAAYDLNDKLRAYEKAGVREYVVLVIHEREVRWFRREENKFVPLPLDTDGVFRSRVFPGLWLNAAAAIQADSAKILQTLQTGLASAEHGAFVEALQRREPAKA